MYETLLKELKSGLQDGSLKSIDVLRAYQWNALKSHLIRNNIVWVSYKFSFGELGTYLPKSWTSRASGRKTMQARFRTEAFG